MKICIVFISLMLNIAFAFGSNSVEQKNIINFMGYEINITKGDENTQTSASILKNGKVIEEIENHNIVLSQAGYLKLMGSEKIKPYIIFNSWSGGAHCCAGITAYELEPKFKKSFEIQGDHQVTMAIDSPSNEYYIKTIDQSFLNWHTCYADSANIVVALQRTKDGKFEIAETNNYVNEDEVLGNAKSIFNNNKYWDDKTFNEKEPYYPGKVTEKVVELIYKNHPELAIEFLNIAWNPKNPHKEQFKKDIKKKLKENNHWLGLEKKGYKLPF